MAIVVPIISSFDSKGINKAIKDFKKLDGAGQKTAFGLLNANKAVNSFGKSFGKLAGIAGGVGGVIGGTLIKAAMESQKVSKQTEAIIKATGSAAGMTTKDIQKLADSMSLKTGIDDEAIQSSMNLLLTFKQVRNEAGKGNDIFNRASMAALDLGNVFGSTDAAAKQLGKALSNPVKGITALTRSGINFTDAQKNQIKTLVASGKTLEAQKIILGEVEAQVGGTAAATATDFDRMKVAVDNVFESLGTLLLPMFEKLSRFITENIVPIFEQFSIVVGQKGLGAGLKFLGDKGLKAIQDLDGWGAVIYGIVAAVTALKVATVAFTVAQGLANIAVLAFGVAWNATGIGLIVSGIALLVVGLAAAYIKFEGFRKVVNSVINGVVGYFEFMANMWRKVINFLIRGYNLLPFVDDVALLGEFKFGRIGEKAAPTGADKSKFDTVPKMAKGGIITKPTLVLAGEAGSEAIIPLSKMNQMNQGGINITIQTGVGDPVAIGREVQKVLNAYGRRTGVAA
jgi:hypothetical protein